MESLCRSESTLYRMRSLCRLGRIVLPDLYNDHIVYNLVIQYSQHSLSRTPRGPPKTFEIANVRHNAKYQNTETLKQVCVKGLRL